MVVGARRVGLSISKTADLLGFSRTTISRVYREWSEKRKYLFLTLKLLEFLHMEDHRLD